ncbi:hypothetical protein Hanom_Chr04g00341321 [Helianthus anomalus]
MKNPNPHSYLQPHTPKILCFSFFSPIAGEQSVSASDPTTHNPHPFIDKHHNPSTSIIGRPPPSFGGGVRRLKRG